MDIAKSYDWLWFADARAHDKMHGNAIDFASDFRGERRKECRNENVSLALHHLHTEISPQKWNSS
jgi:hypothetical protein